MCRRISAARCTISRRRERSFSLSGLILEWTEDDYGGYRTGAVFDSNRGEIASLPARKLTTYGRRFRKLAGGMGAKDAMEASDQRRPFASIRRLKRKCFREAAGFLSVRRFQARESQPILTPRKTNLR